MYILVSTRYRFLLKRRAELSRCVYYVYKGVVLWANTFRPTTASFLISNHSLVLAYYNSLTLFLPPHHFVAQYSTLKRRYRNRIFT